MKRLKIMTYRRLILSLECNIYLSIVPIFNRQSPLPNCGKLNNVNKINLLFVISEKMDSFVFNLIQNVQHNGHFVR
jgi:hypothetical protein